MSNESEIQAIVEDIEARTRGTLARDELAALVEAKLEENLKLPSSAVGPAPRPDLDRIPPGVSGFQWLVILARWAGEWAGRRRKARLKETVLRVVIDTISKRERT